MWIYLDAHLPDFCSSEVDSSNARDRLQFRRDYFVRNTGELAKRSLAALHCDRHDRPIVRIEVIDDRLFDVLRKPSSYSRYLRLHVLLSCEHIDAEIQLHANERHAVQ